MITDGMKTEHVAMVMEIWNAIMQEEVFFPRKRLEFTVKDLKILKDMLENLLHKNLYWNCQFSMKPSMEQLEQICICITCFNSRC